MQSQSPLYTDMHLGRSYKKSTKGHIIPEIYKNFLRNQEMRIKINLLKNFSLSSNEDVLDIET